MLSLTLICLSMNGVFADSSVDVNLNSTQSEMQSVSLDDFSVSDSNVISNVILEGSDMGVCEKGDYFEVSLSDLNNKPLANETIIFNINGANYTKLTDESGIAKLQINLNVGDYTITSIYLGSDIYNKSSIVNSIHVRDVDTTFVYEGMSNDEIQEIINNANQGALIEFVGSSYDNIALVIDKELTLVSNVGTVLNGNPSSSVIKISSQAKNVKISGFNISGALKGIEVENVVGPVEISGNAFTNNGIGVSMNNVENIDVLNNNFNCCDVAISFEESSDVLIKGNIIFKSTDDGIFSKNNNNVEISENNFTNNGFNGNEERGYAIHLAGSCENMKIVDNYMFNNTNAIYVDAAFENLDISRNSIQYSLWYGIRLGENYRKDSAGNDFSLSDNSILNSGTFNIVARDTIYYDRDTAVSFSGYNWVGSTSSSFNGVCPKVSVNMYGDSVVVDGDGNAYYVVGINGQAQSNLPSFIMTVIDNEGTYSVITVSNGRVQLSMDPNVQGISIRTPDGKTQYIENSNYDPNWTPEPTPNPDSGDNPSDVSGNGTASGGSANQGGSTSVSVSGEGTLSGVVGAISGTIAAASTTTQQQDSSSESSVAPSNSAESDTSSSSASSRSVAKTVTVDDEVVRIAGIGVIILIIVLIIAAYYRNDIRDMMNKRKED